MILLSVPEIGIGFVDGGIGKPTYTILNFLKVCTAVGNPMEMETHPVE